MTGNRPGTTPTKLNTWDKSTNSANRIDLSAVWQQYQLLSENQAIHSGLLTQCPVWVVFFSLTVNTGRKLLFKSLPIKLEIAILFSWANSPRLLAFFETVTRSTTWLLAIPVKTTSTNIHWMVLSAMMKALGTQKELIATWIIPAPSYLYRGVRQRTSGKMDFYALKWSVSHCDVVMGLFWACCAFSVYIYYLAESNYQSEAYSK